MTGKELKDLQQVTEDRFNNRGIKSNLHRVKGRWIKTNNWNPLTWMKKEVKEEAKEGQTK